MKKLQTAQIRNKHVRENLGQLHIDYQYTPTIFHVMHQSKPEGASN